VATRPEKRIGSDESWDKAEHALMESLRASGCEFEIAPGDGAFYGPKIEYTLKDALGRQWQHRVHRAGADEQSGRSDP
jgi:threonyl-tRNA synthetase